VFPSIRFRLVSLFYLFALVCPVQFLQAQAISDKPIRPFRTYGIGFTAGTGGIGVQLATPLAQHFNLRASASYFSYYGNFNSDGLELDGRIQLRQINTSVDWFPFHNGFHISPGVTLDNRNDIHTLIHVPGGQSFDLGDDTYTSDYANPVNGMASFSFGNKIAPSLTAGWGNLIPRNGSHFSVPVEVGFQYIGTPLIAFNLQGSACDQSNPPDCGPIEDPTGMGPADIQAQTAKINNDIRPLRFFPILSVGFGYRF
jgi:hypothetical protein